MQEELDSDRRFFTENPNRAHMVRAAFPIEALFLREQAHILEGPGTIPDGKIVMVVKQLAPGPAAAVTAASRHGLMMRTTAGVSGRRSPGDSQAMDRTVRL